MGPGLEGSSLQLNTTRHELSERCGSGRIRSQVRVRNDLPLVWRAITWWRGHACHHETCTAACTCRCFAAP